MKTATAIATILASSFALGALPAAGQAYTAEVKGEQSTLQRVTPHSHAQEKTGAPQPQPAATLTASGPNPWRDYSRHFHPRDK